MQILIHLLIILHITLNARSQEVQANDPFALAVAERIEDKDLRIQIPKDELKGSGVRLEVEEVQGNVVTLKLLNDSKETVYVPGHGFKAPFYEAETYSNDRWRFDPSHMNCGTGAYLAPLASGQLFRFKVKLLDGTRLARINFQFEGGADDAGNRKLTNLCTAPIEIQGKPSN